MTPDRPLLRYFGGKWRLAPRILPYFPPHRIYCEAFGGGASLLLQKPESYGEIYNDLDGEVVNVFRVLQRHPRKFERVIRCTPFARDEMEIAYRQVKDPVERARRTVIRSFMGFGSDSVTRDCRTGFRSNSNRSGTNPAHDWASWPDNIRAFHDRLRKVVIENRDACEVMASQDCEETLHYVDPPYVHDTRTSGHGYRFEMTDDDHRKLLGFLITLKGMVIVSGYSHPIYESLGWAKVTLEAMTFHKGNVGAPRTECLWINSACVKAQSQQSLFDGRSA